MKEKVFDINNLLLGETISLCRFCKEEFPMKPGRHNWTCGCGRGTFKCYMQNNPKYIENAEVRDFFGRLESKWIVESLKEITCPK
jgi:hypothetical protein